VTGGAPFGVGGNYIDGAVWLQGLVKFIYATGVDSVVVA